MLVGMSLIDIPKDFGQGGANIGDGAVKLQQILQNHSEEIQTAADTANGAAEAAFGAVRKGISIDQAFEVYQSIADQPGGVKTVSFEFNEGVALDSSARFLVASLFLSQVFDNAGHTGIRAAIGTADDHEKYMSFASLTDGGKEGTEFSGAGDASLFLLAPIGGDVPVLTVASDDDLNTITQGRIGAKVFYSTP